MDPLSRVGGVGEWNNNSQYAPFHTQSTRSYSDECFSSGGLDDRFDFILMSDEIYMGFNKIKYVDNSYYALGNDGQHFNQSIDQNGNSAVPASVASALYDISDHLPVTMKLHLYSQWGVDDNEAERVRIYPNPTSGVLNVDVVGTVDYKINNIMGQVMKTGTVGASHQIDITGLSNGLYFITVNGVTTKFVKTSP